jgi:hypothetical protein
VANFLGAEVTPVGEPVAPLLQEERSRFHLMLELSRLDIDLLLNGGADGEKKRHAPPGFTFVGWVLTEFCCNSAGLRLTGEMVNRELQTLKRMAGPRDDVDCLRAIVIVPRAPRLLFVLVSPR